uniref:NADH-ubiquinone oxidoreductase chain 2 n=1 Tax=Lachesilla anna TaxID=239245 RepID=A0A343QCG1_9NEOP|nr:NADH dehydrogenase subunit 2 [Lachesilla anna]ATU07108.1 NADH dehydrogenase subunit 2 [Lachesilla anna]
MLNNLNLLFSMLIFISSILTISSSSWLGAWIGLELNMLSFVPLLIEQKNSSSNEAGLKYFLVQAMASSLFITLSILNTFSFFSFSIFNYSTLNYLMIPILIKLGAAPFQTWFIMLMNKINWFKALLLATWQKIAPLTLLSFMNSSNFVVTIIASLSLFTGAIGGLTQTTFQKIFAFSSINHLGWLISTLLTSKQLLVIYLTMYIFMNTILFVILFLFNTFSFSQNLFSSKTNVFTLSILSLSGLPPFWGFISKWLVVQNMIMTGQLMMNFLLISSALINLIFYLRLIMNYSLLSFSSMKWMFNPENFNLTVATLFTLNLFGLILFNLILF